MEGPVAHVGDCRSVASHPFSLAHSTIGADMIRTGNRPQSWREMHRILNKGYVNSSFTQDDAKILFTDIRRYMEIMKISDFPTLKSICNIIFHDDLTIGNSLFPIKYFVKKINNLSDKDSISNLGFESLSWVLMFEELDQLILNASLPDKIVFDANLKDELSVSALQLDTRINRVF